MVGKPEMVCSPDVMAGEPIEVLHWGWENGRFTGSPTTDQQSHARQLDVDLRRFP